MEDKPKAEQQEKGGGSEPAPLPVAELASRGRASESGMQKALLQGPPRGHLVEPSESRWRRLWRWIYPMEFSDFVMVLLTGAIAIGTIVSAGAICFQWYEMRIGGRDTGRIADAAQKQADAAQQFSDTADDINGNVNDAVAKLNLQAGQAARLAAGAEQANQLARYGLEIGLAANRPILEVFDPSPIHPYEGLFGEGTTRFQFKIKNTGTSQAVNIRYEVSQPHSMIWDRPDHAAVIEAQINKPGGTLGDNPTTGTISNVLGHDEVQSPIAVVSGLISNVPRANFEIGEYFYGQLDWDDDLGFGHWEREFCIMVGLHRDQQQRDMVPTIQDCGINMEPHLRPVTEHSSHRNHGKSPISPFQ